HLPAGGLKERSGRGDFYGLRRLAHLKLYIDKCAVTQAKHDPGPAIGLKTRLLDAEDVLPRGQSYKVVFSSLIGHDRVSRHRGLIFSLELRIGDSQTGRILDRPEELGAPRLSVSGHGNHEEKQECPHSLVALIRQCPVSLTDCGVRYSR